VVDGTLQRPASPDRCKQHSHAGHDIPVDAIARRFPRSLYNFFQLFSPLVDQAYCFMNNDTVPTLVFQQNAGQRQVLHHEFFELLQQEAQR
jgi:predicted ABC-type ATPase